MTMSIIITPKNIKLKAKILKATEDIVNVMLNYTAAIAFKNSPHLCYYTNTQIQKLKSYFSSLSTGKAYKELAKLFDIILSP